jgi:hypothetical protein
MVSLRSACIDSHSLFNEHCDSIECACRRVLLRRHRVAQRRHLPGRVADAARRNARDRRRHSRSARIADLLGDSGTGGSDGLCRRRGRPLSRLLLQRQQRPVSEIRCVSHQMHRDTGRARSASHAAASYAIQRHSFLSCVSTFTHRHSAGRDGDTAQRQNPISYHLLPNLAQKGTCSLAVGAIGFSNTSFSALCCLRASSQMRSPI